MDTPLIKLNNGVVIPQLGMGVFHSEPGAETSTAVRWAIEAGYRHIDTAIAYNNEADVTAGILESGVKREEVFVSSKVASADIRGNTVREGIERSLDKSPGGYWDQLLIHWPVPGFIDAYEILLSFYEAKRVRVIGVSNFEPHHIQALLDRGYVLPAVNQVELHPSYQQKNVKRYCAEKGIAVEAWSPLGGRDHSLLGVPELIAIGEKYGKSSAQTIIRWHLQSGHIVIPKSVKKQRIIENSQVFDFELSTEDMAAIAALDTNKRSYWDPTRWD